jgi:hypothetical protein
MTSMINAHVFFDFFDFQDPDLSTVLLEMIGVSDNDVAVLFGVQKVNVSFFVPVFRRRMFVAV